jgi:hypothetical protein
MPAIPPPMTAASTVTSLVSAGQDVDGLDAIQ